MSVQALFIADLHLQASVPGTVALACKFLKNLAPSAPRLYILGDLVEYWIGDDNEDSSLDEVFDALRRLSLAGTQITLMLGNRDFLLGKSFASRVGAELVTDDQLLLEITDRPILLLHGDTLCTDDHAYQQMRRQLRSAEWQADFLAQSIQQRRAFANDLRQKSQQLSAQREHQIMDVNDAAVRNAMERYQVQLMIHGHTHKPAQHELNTLGGKAQRYVVGDWHADHATYAVLENDSISLQTFRA